jgi:DNA-binding GntR family transcriptional regulator
MSGDHSSFVLAEHDGSARLHQRAYVRLCEALMQGEFVPGQQLTFRSLAEALGVSVTPVREAVATLAELGALRVHPKRFIEVARLSPEAYVEMLELRRLLEGHASARAAERVTSAELEEIREINSALLRYNREGRYREAMKENYRFHFAVYRASRANFLVESIERVWLLIGPSLNLHLAEEYGRDTQVLQTGFENHDRLIDALAARDPAAAMRAILGDMSVSASHMLTGLLRGSNLSVDALIELSAFAAGATARPGRRPRTETGTLANSTDR